MNVPKPGILPVLGMLCATLALAAPIAHSRQESSPEAAELAALVRTLRNTKTLTAYSNLKRFAERNTAPPIGPRAALALGQYDYANNRYESAVNWLRIAAKDPLLPDYAAYWHAQVERATGRHAAALTRLEELRATHPRSALAADAREAMALAALLSGQPEKTAALLAGDLSARPEMLLARAQAHEKLGKFARAAEDYNTIYYTHPFTPEAGIAAPRITALRARLKAEFPGVPAAQIGARVQAFLDDKRCSDARSEAKRLAPALSQAQRDTFSVRAAVCMRRGVASPKALEKLKVSDPEANAERLYHLSQLYRGKRDESRILAAVEEAGLRHPASPWTARALFQAGNHYWAKFDHARAAIYYQRLFDAFPESEDAHAAHWRVAWQAYLENSARARTRMEEHLRRFRGSPHGVNALYWLGRLSERNGERAEARSFYAKAVQRYPQTYYARQASERLRELGGGGIAGETGAAPEILSAIPDPAPAVSLSANLDGETRERIARGEARAQALAAIGLDDYAERELISVFQETRAAQLLLAAAQLAHDANRFYNGILLGRRLVPHLESRRLPELPEEIWRAVYPFVYGDGIQATAEMAGLDPMLVAGLIRQESVFQAGAVSRAGACGLMQVMPRTGRQLARQLRLSYSRSRLFQPEFNLRLGTTHLARLVRQYDSVEAALAAYNAGEGRVASWRASRTFSEPAEFVESIPITETREYVQIVLRNREIYRSLYGSPNAASISDPDKP